MILLEIEGIASCLTVGLLSLGVVPVSLSRYCKGHLTSHEFGACITGCTPLLFNYISIALQCSSEDVSGFFVSLLFGLGPLLGGMVLVAFALAFRLQHALLTGVASGIAFVLGAWRPLQLLLSSNMGFFPIVLRLALGSAFSHISTTTALKLAIRKRTFADTLSAPRGFSMSALTLQSFLSCVAVALHALAEGLALGVAAPKAYGLGRHMVLPVSLHGLPRGAAVASCIFGATDGTDPLQPLH